MKAILIAMAMMASGAAFGGEFTSVGRIHFQKAATWVPANKVCVADGVYYHKTKANIEVEYCNESDSGSKSNCRMVSKPLVQPMISSRQVCTQWTGSDDQNCAATAVVRYVQGPTVKVEIFGSQRDMEENRSPIRTGSYTISNCARGSVVAH